METQTLGYVPARSRHRARIAYLFGALGGILFGYDSGVIAGALLFIRKDMTLNAQLQGMVVGGLLLGAMVGAFGTGRFADRYGPRKMLIGAGVMFIVTSVLSALAPDPLTLIVARVLIGITIGVSTVQVPLYLSEIAPKHIRGGLASMNQLAIATGILISYVICYVLAPHGQWRWMLGLAAVPSVFLTIGMIFQPDSPRWLVRQGRIDEARRVLEITNTPSGADESLREIQRANEGAPTVRLPDVLRSKALRPTLISVFGLAVLQQALGINTIVYYAPTILRTAGFGESTALLNSVGLGVLSIFMTIFAARVVDRVGRRPLLITGALVMALSMAALGLVFHFGATSTSTGSTLAVAALALFKAAFSFSWGPLVWVMMPELLPLRIRARTMSAAALAMFLMNFIVASTFPALLEMGAASAFAVFSGCCVVACLFAIYRIRETAGLSLEEIEKDVG
ncbi:sugar porter family MFS transporter [Paraburkholderia unamae]|uniref:Sugar porter (SP) family MFS transporter n=1 Tax=Paraburkholderia unamae TaxID=219649 RepID=A0ABX5KNT4_9BURK|nr:sugar porter family MFS transporter [Paraburkholderia unamae]PVX83973.1 sugar porter (SP) family MFS transporter [Paraburkholderia unamae]CAG9265006.1 putative metabolite transport protein CsbC [Paraburkholderia unamae]